MKIRQCAEAFSTARKNSLSNYRNSVLCSVMKLVECPRDAWQGLSRQIPTELKARYLQTLIEAGFKHVDAVSFVSPKAVPQIADREHVLEQIDVPHAVQIIRIVGNETGVPP